MSTVSSFPSAEIARFHLSLNVSNLVRSVEFYRTLFGLEPAKQRADYAKFELDAPPLVLALIPGRAASGGTLNHAGLRVASAEELVAIQQRLEVAGIRTQREDGVECCYARQTKFWVADPDGALWEIYILHEDIEEHGDDLVPDLAHVASLPQQSPRPKIHWQHTLSEPVPTRIPHADNSVDEALLEGTFNLNLPAGQLDDLLHEVHRVLRPGGEVQLHGLAGDRPLSPQDQATLALSGPAAVVQYVPMENEPLLALVNAGFVGARYEKFSAKPYFVVSGVAMREILIVAQKSGHRPPVAKHIAIYQGPFACITDDFGNILRRGERTHLNIHDWLALKSSPAAEQVLLLSPEEVIEETVLIEEM